jgi:mannosyl-glycoprotein endo-beta-N-acetylglucosaminidase
LQKLVNGKPGEEFYYANKLMDIVDHYGFDGWFFNIECKVEPEYVFKLLEFLEYMTIICHQRIQGSLVLWYDSVTVHGDLKWQDALNENNLTFFDKYADQM